MNCKPGDLAVIVRSADGAAVGRIVEVLMGDGSHSEFGHIWRVKSRGKGVVTIHGTLAVFFHMPDAWLRPIRDDGGQDETLVWKDVPLPSITKEVA